MQLRYDPDPILSEVCLPITEVTDDIRTLVAKMWVTMLAERGAGLAAPQVGEALRLFITFNPSNPEAPLVYINPTIVLKSPKKEKGLEGCLSFPGRQQLVERPKEISIRALDLQGKSFVLKAKDFLARCIQHEFDHLEGRTIFPLAT